MESHDLSGPLEDMGREGSEDARYETPVHGSGTQGQHDGNHSTALMLMHLQPPLEADGSRPLDESSEPSSDAHHGYNTAELHHAVFSDPFEKDTDLPVHLTAPAVVTPSHSPSPYDTPHPPPPPAHSPAHLPAPAPAHAMMHSPLHMAVQPPPLSPAHLAMQPPPVSTVAPVPAHQPVPAPAPTSPASLSPASLSPAPQPHAPPAVPALPHGLPQPFPAPPAQGYHAPYTVPAPAPAIVPPGHPGGPPVVHYVYPEYYPYAPPPPPHGHVYYPPAAYSTAPTTPRSAESSMYTHTHTPPHTPTHTPGHTPLHGPMAAPVPAPGPIVMHPAAPAYTQAYPQVQAQAQAQAQAQNDAASLDLVRRFTELLASQAARDGFDGRLTYQHPTQAPTHPPVPVPVGVGASVALAAPVERPSMQPASTSTHEGSEVAGHSPSDTRHPSPRRGSPTKQRAAGKGKRRHGAQKEDPLLTPGLRADSPLRALLHRGGGPPLPPPHGVPVSIATASLPASASPGASALPSSRNASPQRIPAAHAHAHAPTPHTPRTPRGTPKTPRTARPSHTQSPGRARGGSPSKPCAPRGVSPTKARGTHTYATGHGQGHMHGHGHGHSTPRGGMSPVKARGTSPVKARTGSPAKARRASPVKTRRTPGTRSPRKQRVSEASYATPIRDAVTQVRTPEALRQKLEAAVHAASPARRGSSPRRNCVTPPPPLNAPPSPRILVPAGSPFEPRARSNSLSGGCSPLTYAALRRMSVSRAREALLDREDTGSLVNSIAASLGSSRKGGTSSVLSFPHSQLAPSTVHSERRYVPGERPIFNAPDSPGVGSYDPKALHRRGPPSVSIARSVLHGKAAPAMEEQHLIKQYPSGADGRDLFPRSASPGPGHYNTDSVKSVMRCAPARSISPPKRSSSRVSDPTEHTHNRRVASLEAGRELFPTTRVPGPGRYDTAEIHNKHLARSSTQHSFSRQGRNLTARVKRNGVLLDLSPGEAKDRTMRRAKGGVIHPDRVYEAYEHQQEAVRILRSLSPRKSRPGTPVNTHASPDAESYATSTPAPAPTHTGPSRSLAIAVPPPSVAMTPSNARTATTSPPRPRHSRTPSSLSVASGVYDSPPKSHVTALQPRTPPGTPPRSPRSPTTCANAHVDAHAHANHNAGPLEQPAPRQPKPQRPSPPRLTERPIPVHVAWGPDEAQAENHGVRDPGDRLSDGEEEEPEEAVLAITSISPAP